MFHWLSKLPSKSKSLSNFKDFRWCWNVTRSGKSSTPYLNLIRNDKSKKITLVLPLSDIFSKNHPQNVFAHNIECIPSFTDSSQVCGFIYIYNCYSYFS